MNKEKLQKLAINLSKKAPRSPKLRIGSFAHLPRMLDKCRAELLGINGEYHYNCPTDKKFFEFTKINPEKLKEFVSQGKTDQEVLEYVIKESKLNDSVIKAWTTGMVGSFPTENPHMKEWFTGVCKTLKLDAEITTLFDYLEADDKASFK